MAIANEPYEGDNRHMTTSHQNPHGLATEHALRLAIVQACNCLAVEGLNALNLLSLSHRWSRSAAQGLLTTPDLMANTTEPSGLRWHAFAKSPNTRDDNDHSNDANAWLDEDPQTGCWHWLHQGLLNDSALTQCVLLLAPPFATALACLPRVQAEGLPAFHPALAAFGGDDLACAPMVTPQPITAQAASSSNPTGQSTNKANEANETIEAVLKATAGRHACLLANQGMLVSGQSLAQTIARARQLEGLARIYTTALQMGEPAILDAGQMNECFAAWQTPV